MPSLSEAELAKDAARPRQGRIAAFVTWALEWLAVTLLGSLAALVFANATGRYLFTRPLPWTEEAAIHILIWLAAAGLVLAGLRQCLICCNMFAGLLTGQRARILAACCALLGFAVMLFVAWLTWQYLLIFGHDLSPVLRIPKGVAISGLLFAAIGLSATFLGLVFKR